MPDSTSYRRESGLDLSWDPRGSDAESVEHFEGKSRAIRSVPSKAAVVCRTHPRVCPHRIGGMSNMLTVPALTLLFICVVVGLGAAFIWMFWELEQRMAKLHRISKPHRKSDRAA